MVGGHEHPRTLQATLGAREKEVHRLTELVAQRSATIRAQDNDLARKEQRVATLSAALHEITLKLGYAEIGFAKPVFASYQQSQQSQQMQQSQHCVLMG